MFVMIFFPNAILDILLSFSLCNFFFYDKTYYCSVHAYIVFKTEESAQASLSHNMAAVHSYLNFCNCHDSMLSSIFVAIYMCVCVEIYFFLM